MALFVERSNQFAEAEVTEKMPQSFSQPTAQPGGRPVAQPAQQNVPQPAAREAVAPPAPAPVREIQQGAQPVGPVGSPSKAPSPAPSLAPSPVPTRTQPGLAAPQFPQAHYPGQGHEAINRGVLPTPGPKLINEEELKLLNAIAAIQIRYGKPEEAIAWLAMVRKQYPGDYQSARLFAVALMKMNRFAEANQAISELEHIETEGGLSLLYRSLLEFKNNQVASARNWFKKFLGQRGANKNGSINGTNQHI